MTSLNVVIMCGGSGSRLWPKSRDLFPKQFLTLTDPDLTMFQVNCKNALKLTPNKFIIVCNEKHNFLVEQQLEELFIKNYLIISEPYGKNTSAAIASASLVSDPNSLLVVLTADHVWDNQEFLNVINAGINKINDKSVVFIGIQPTYPETGYGYIKCENENVLAFVEKPNIKTATKYLQEGNYLWNSGVFLFLNETIKKEFMNHASDIYSDVNETIKNSNKIKQCIHLNKDFFYKVRDESIDYAIMEKHKFGKIVAYQGYWCDIGSFESLFNHMKKDGDTNSNIISGDVLTLDTRNSYIESENRLITTIGIDNLVVIDTRDALLIAKKDDSQKVKDIVKQLKNLNREETNSHAKVFRPWGWYINIEGTNTTGFKVKRIGVYPGKRLSLQSHNRRSEHWVIIKGNARVQVGKDILNLEPNQHVYIPKETLHRMENPGDEIVEFIETQIGDYLGEDDIVRYEDDFGRV
jgi:mannose-1-phosphate guanylyltransferase/mannose-6-phosphate isomerase